MTNNKSVSFFEIHLRNPIGSSIETNIGHKELFGTNHNFVTTAYATHSTQVVLIMNLFIEFIHLTVITIEESAALDIMFLMATMAFETAETFSPSVRNPLSNATGLIQFMPYKGKLHTLADVYIAILYPRAVNKASDFVLFRGVTVAY